MRFPRFVIDAALARVSLALLLVLSGGSAAMAEPAATVVFATGGAGIVGVDGAVRRAERGAPLSAGETVDTADGRMQLRFLDGAVISLQPATRFQVEQFRFSGRGGRAAEEDHVAMRFLKGALRAVSGLIGRERREQYRMDTAVGTIGIRGTEYGATLGGDGLSVTTYAGLVEVCNNAGCERAGPGQSLLVTDAGLRPQLQGGGAAPPQQPAAPAVPAVPAVPDLPPAQTAPLPTAPVQPETQPQQPTYNPNTGGYRH